MGQKAKATLQKLAVEKACRSHSDIAIELLEVFSDSSIQSDPSNPPTTALEEKEEIIRSSVFVRIPGFGTRTTTIVSLKGNAFQMTEKNHATPHSESSFSEQVIHIE